MIQRAIEHDPKLYMSPIELKLEEPYYTHKTLKALKEEYPNDQFYLIVGADVASTIKNWEEGEWINQNFPRIVVTRPGFEFEGVIDINYTINISSTEIRNLVKEDKSIKYLVHPGVEEIIRGAKLYK